MLDVRRTMFDLVVDQLLFCCNVNKSQLILGLKIVSESEDESTVNQLRFEIASE